MFEEKFSTLSNESPWVSKKSFVDQKKISQETKKKKNLGLDKKYNLFNNDKFLLSFSTFIWNYYLQKLLTTQILTSQKFIMVVVLRKATE